MDSAEKFDENEYKQKEIFNKLKSSNLWKENDFKLIYEPLKFIHSNRHDCFITDSKSSHRILIPKFASLDLSDILPKSKYRELKSEAETSKIFLVADDSFGKTSTLKYIYSQYQKAIDSIINKIKITDNIEYVLSDDNSIHFPIFIDLPKLDWNGKNSLTEKISNFLNIDTSYFKEFGCETFIFLFDEVDQVPNEYIHRLLRDLRLFEYNYIIAINKKFYHRGFIDENNTFYEILPLNKCQTVDLIKHIIESHNSVCPNKDKIEILNSKKFAAILPFILLPAEARNPHFISLYTEKIIDYIISEKIPEIPFKLGKLAPDEIHKFLYDINKENLYLFSWNEITGNNYEGLINFLNQNYNIEWVKTAEIEKIEGGTTIRVFANNNFLSLELNDEKTKVNLKIDDGRTDEFIAKAVSGKLNIYENFKGGSTFDLFKTARNDANELVNKIFDGEHINIDNIYVNSNDFSNSFFYQRLFIKEFIENLSSNNESDEFLKLYVSSIIDFIKYYSPPHPNEFNPDDTTTQVCFEYLAIIVRYLKSFYHEKYHDIQKFIFEEMLELYYSKSHYFIKLNALWLMRLSYDPDDEKFVEHGERLLYNMNLSPTENKLEDFDLFYSELLFVIKHPNFAFGLLIFTVLFKRL